MGTIKIVALALICLYPWITAVILYLGTNATIQIAISTASLVVFMLYPVIQLIFILLLLPAFYNPNRPEDNDHKP